MSAGKAVLLEVTNDRSNSETSTGLTQRHSVTSQETGIICPLPGVSSSLSNWPTRMKAIGVIETSEGLTQTHSVASHETELYVHCLVSILLCPIDPQECIRFLRNVGWTPTDTTSHPREFEYSRNIGLRSVLRIQDCFCVDNGRWGFIPFSALGLFRRFGGKYCLCLQLKRAPEPNSSLTENEGSAQLLTRR